VEVRRVYVGTFMTSLDMAGFSLSLLLLRGEATLAALDAHTQVLYPFLGPTDVKRLRKKMLRKQTTCSLSDGHELHWRAKAEEQTFCTRCAQAPAWPAPLGEHAAEKQPLPLPRGPEQAAGHSGRPGRLTALGVRMERCLLAAAAALTQAAPDLDALDARRAALAGIALAATALACGPARGCGVLL
jgi:hypothetical protein